MSKEEADVARYHDHRMDIYNRSLVRLRATDFDITPDDVIALAEFLAGDHVEHPSDAGA